MIKRFLKAPTQALALILHHFCFFPTAVRPSVWRRRVFLRHGTLLRHHFYRVATVIYLPFGRVICRIHGQQYALVLLTWNPITSLSSIAILDHVTSTTRYMVEYLRWNIVFRNEILVRLRILILEREKHCLLN